MKRKTTVVIDQQEAIPIRRTIHKAMEDAKTMDKEAIAKEAEAVAIAIIQFIERQEID